MIHSRNILSRIGIHTSASHWLWAIPVLLAVAALSIRQIDLYPPITDEFYSMNNAGWLADTPYSAIEVLDSLIENSPNHTPLYFLILNQWGRLVGTDVAVGRLLSIFAGMLSLAMMYRLARDTVAPIAGVFAMALLASNALYSFYFAHLRMYPLLVFGGTMVLWLYLRIIRQQTDANFLDYLVLFVSSYALLNIHAISGLFFGVLVIHHVLAVPKNRQWTLVCLPVLAALLLFSPWLHVLVTYGIERSFQHPAVGEGSTWQFLQAWLISGNNGGITLLLVSLIGFRAERRADFPRDRKLLYLVWIFLLAFAVTAAVSDTLTTSRLRLTLVGLPALILSVSAGLTLLYRVRRWLALLALLGWVYAGFAMYQSVDWVKFIAGDVNRYEMPPWQVISRIAQQSPLDAPLVSYNVSRMIFGSPTHINYSQEEYFFRRHGIEVESIFNLTHFKSYVRSRAITEPAIRLYFRPPLVEKAELAEIMETMGDAGYLHCQDEIVGVDTVLRLLMWNSLACQQPRLEISSRSRLVDYEFYAATLDGTTLYFVDRWTTRQSADVSGYSMSYQLIDEDWINEAQVDLEMVHEGETRQFSIDVSQVSPGKYRLVLILYNPATGDLLNWEGDTGYTTEMLKLADITISNP